MDLGVRPGSVDDEMAEHFRVLREEEAEAERLLLAGP
jgi:hypothetical protein